MHKLFFVAMQQQANINIRFCFKLGEAATEIYRMLEMFMEVKLCLRCALEGLKTRVYKFL